jgi:hypothetical protein
MKKWIAFFLAAWVCMTPALALTDQEMDEAVEKAGQEAIEACIQEDMTDLEKMTALHDWLCLNCDYGATLRSGTVYGALVEGTGVCTGYAGAYAYLATLAGLDGVDTYSTDMDHAWILVTLDSQRYFSDTTWDDGKNAKMGLIRHSYWLFDETNAMDTNHYGWDSPESVPGGDLESAPWGQAVTRVIFQGDYAYYIDNEFCLWRCDRATWETELLLQVDEQWPIWGVDNSGRDGVYSGLVLLGDRLVFNTPYVIYSVDLEGQNLKPLLTPDTSEGVIYGIDVRDGYLCYSIATEPDAVKYEIKSSGLFAWNAWGYTLPEELLPLAAQFEKSAS